MAKIYAPNEAPPSYDDAKYKDADGRLDWKAYDAEVERYIERVKQDARDKHPGDVYAGEPYYVPMGDGKAIYVVWSSKPLTLLHLDVWDAWRASAAEERGLRLSDIKARMNFEKVWRELGEKQAAERADKEAT